MSGHWDDTLLVDSNHDVCTAVRLVLVARYHSCTSINRKFTL
ncbi:hypothetical protein [Wolbachia endosymbiont (group A) of Brachyopa scutellaris]